jgi:hypothetical protein
MCLLRASVVVAMLSERFGNMTFARGTFIRDRTQQVRDAIQTGFALVIRANRCHGAQRSRSLPASCHGPASIHTSGGRIPDPSDRFIGAQDPNAGIESALPFLLTN